MAINFPASIDPPAWPFECEYENNSIISKFEDGSQQSSLMNFISQTVSFSARSFNWTNTDSVDDQDGAEVVEVRITNVGKWTNEALHYWSGSIELTEV